MKAVMCLGPASSFNIVTPGATAAPMSEEIDGSAVCRAASSLGPFLLPVNAPGHWAGTRKGLRPAPKRPVSKLLTLAGAWMMRTAGACGQGQDGGKWRVLFIRRRTLRPCRTPASGHNNDPKQQSGQEWPNPATTSVCRPAMCVRQI